MTEEVYVFVSRGRGKVLRDPVFEEEKKRRAVNEMIESEIPTGMG